MRLYICAAEEIRLRRIIEDALSFCFQNAGEHLSSNYSSK